MSHQRICALCVLAIGVGIAQFTYADDAANLAQLKLRKWAPIDVSEFRDSIHHAVMKNKNQKPNYPQYAPEQIVGIAENILAYQNGDGGWPKNIDWTKIMSEVDLAKLPHGREGIKGAGETTFDNYNTWTQIDYLARVYQQTKMQRYADAAIKGIDYILSEQRISGGWRGMDVDAITFNDGVMSGVLQTLKAIVENKDLYSFVDDARRAKAKDEFNKGIRCTLDCQINIGDRLTAWCEQHDHATLRPIWARTFEMPSITPDESVDVVRLLMSIDHPTPDVIHAVQSAVAWFDHVKILGLRIQKVPAPPVEFEFHYSDSDSVEVQDPSAPPIWARYYDLETEKPIFCNRDRKLTTHFSEVDRERRTGMPWYGYWPAKLLKKEYPVWQKKWDPEHNVLAQRVVK